MPVTVCPPAGSSLPPQGRASFRAQSFGARRWASHGVSRSVTLDLGIPVRGEAYDRLPAAAGLLERGGRPGQCLREAGAQHDPTPAKIGVWRYV